MSIHTNMLASGIYQDKQAKSAARARVAGLTAAAGQISGAQEKLSTYEEYGTQSLERMNKLFQDPSYLENLPGYKFALEQGLKGTTAMRSKTSIFSGETLKALTEYASGLASQTYQQEWQRLQSGIATGMGAEQQYGNLASTGAEIQAGIGEAKARRSDTMAAWGAGQESFGRQIFGQWSGAFAGASASSSGACWVAEELYGKFDARTIKTRQFVLAHAKDDTSLGEFFREYIKNGKEWAKLVVSNKEIREQVLPIWNDLYKMAIEELGE